MRQTHPKTAGYSNVVRLADIAQRRGDALERASHRNKRTGAEQLALLDSRPGLALKERTRIEAAK